MKAIKEYISPLHKIHADDRGILAHIFDNEKFSVLYITSKKDSVRANHYHKTGEHWCYIIKGSLIYSIQTPGKIDESSTLVNAGEIIYTPPMQEHAMRFLEDTEFITVSPHTREQENYEDDLVRVKLI